MVHNHKIKIISSGTQLQLLNKVLDQRKVLSTYLGISNFNNSTNVLILSVSKATARQKSARSANH